MHDHPTQRRRASTPGIEERHQTRCSSRSGGTCRCKPSYRGWVYSPRDDKKIRSSWFPSKSAAKLWRADAQTQVHKGTLRAAARTTLSEAAEQWLDGAEKGRIRTRAGGVYKPSAVRSYRAALEQRVLPEFGAMRLADIRRSDLLAFVEALAGEGLGASTVRNAITPLRSIYRRALDHGDVMTNPTAGLKLPTVRLERIEMWSPDEAACLIKAWHAKTGSSGQRRCTPAFVVGN